MDTPVLIVGAGPTGLMLANQLARHGVAATIIDRHSGPAQQTRAMAVQARTLEIYAQLGIAEQALALGQRATGANLWAEGQRKARIPVGDIGKNLSPFPFVLLLGQDDNERLLGEHLRDWNIIVQWNTELIGLEQKADCVTATLRQADGTNRIVTAAYVAGCDGSRSMVRTLANINFPGAPYEQVFFVADTAATGSMIPGEINIYLWGTGFHLFFPMHGTNHWRVIGILPKQLRDKDELTFTEVSPTIRQEAGANLSFQSCSWFSIYHIHHRCVERFRDRRCFLLGDAAHIHSPVGGQGMNTGLQDAYNLAWKLALVVQNRADATLLDTYEDERLPVAQRLLQTTDRAFTLVVSDNWLARLFRTRILARIATLAMTFERVRKFAFMTVSQIGIQYRHSSLSQTEAEVPDDAPRAGDRFPWLKLRLQTDGPIEDLFRKLDDKYFNLIVIGQTVPSDIAANLNGLLPILVIPEDRHNKQELADACIPTPAFYLLRPDGHIGLAGIHLTLAAITNYFEKYSHFSQERV